MEKRRRLICLLPRNRTTVCSLGHKLDSPYRAKLFHRTFTVGVAHGYYGSGLRPDGFAAFFRSPLPIWNEAPFARLLIPPKAEKKFIGANAIEAGTS